jgi:hypothetical protein
VEKLNVALVEWDAVPGEPAPLMFTTNEPAVGEVHERLEVPVPLAASDTGVTVNGLHVRPASVSATVPAKLNVLVRVTVDVIEEPVNPTGDVALIVKSPT